MSERSAAQHYYDPPDNMLNYPTCDICDERQFCCDDPWCAGNDWDGERGVHRICYERTMEDLEQEVLAIPDGSADVKQIAEYLSILGVSLRRVVDKVFEDPDRAV